MVSLVEKNISTKEEFSNKFLLNKLAKLLKPHRNELCFAITSLLTTIAVILFCGSVVKNMIDNGFSTSSHQNLLVTVMVFGLSIIVLAVSGYCRSLLVNNISTSVVNSLRIEAYSAIMLTNSSFFTTYSVGKVVNHLGGEIRTLEGLIGNSFSFLFRNVALLVGSLIALFNIDARLTLATISLIPFVALPLVIFIKNFKNIQQKITVAEDLIIKKVIESVSAIKTVKAYRCEEFEIDHFTKLSSDKMANDLIKNRQKAKMVAIIVAMTFGFVAILLWIGGLAVINKEISVGSLSAFIFYAIIASVSLISIAQSREQMKTAKNSIVNILRICQFDNLVGKNSDVENISKIEDRDNLQISIRNIKFWHNNLENYNDKSIKIVNFNLEILPREKIAIIGKSGSGKTTLFELMLAFSKPESGSILINGISIDNILTSSLRSCFCYVSQDYPIFSGTIFSNIIYGNSLISRDAVEKIISQFKVFDFITKLPKGLDSDVVENGNNFSGGEKQRIAVARALISNAPVLLLDEISSALDKDSQKDLYEAINAVAQNKTVLMATHQVPNNDFFNRIISIED